MRQQPQRRFERGFTILELLVVLLIIGIVVSMASLSVGGNEARALRDEAQRLTSLVDLAIQESVLNGRELGLELNDVSYQFLVYDGTNWLPISGIDEFRPRELPPGIELEVEIEGQAAFESLSGETEASQIWIMSSGEVSPFIITLKLKDGPFYRLNGDMMGGLKLEGPLES
ncbi:MAG TPA: type II secretion system protein GspH [Candidatus Tenderia electrophaga]|uniref:Type II secretion system protein H n=1 Tax=Candidatus Tenderia electrophaga TaxID=1748243 RepID=A0A832J8N9_9GAMM|nr:type II secretion system protein GspH [Candidatus Tenderia electrophaga]